MLPDSPFQAGIWLIVGVVVISRLQEWLRQRFVYPRSGYVVYREHKSQVWKSLLSAAIASILAGAMLVVAIQVDFEGGIQWVPLIVGGIIALVLLWKGIQLRLIRLVLLGIFSLLAGVFFSPLVFAPERTEWYYGIYQFGFYLFIFGIMATLSGSLRFWRYLRDNPQIPEANHE